MKKILIASLFTALAVSSFAQIDKILADPDVIWAAEAEYVSKPDVVEPVPGGDRGFLSSMVLKNTPAQPDKLYSDIFNLSGILLDLAQRPDQAVFEDPQLQHRLSMDEVLSKVSRLDTVITFDPETFEDPVRVNRSFLMPGECAQIHARQLLYYREKTAEFGLQTLALGLARNDGTVLFWFQAPAPAQPAPDVTDPSVVWGRRVGLQNVLIELGDMKTLKQTANPFPQVFLDRVMKDPQIDIFDGKNWSTPARGDDRDNLCYATDTIVTFNPETYEEHVQILRMEFNATNIRLGVVQDWYWDDRRERLIIKPLAVCPIIHQMDADGNYLFSRPIFYRKIK
ncbi:MAG TPA: hypothetical protein PKL15_10450 [Saprospiraceae bacterium]|nr:hypothetical protein [Saprospiraceae bacterium]